MTTVAFLQNSWFPAAKHKIIKYAYSKHGATPEDRADLNARYLFWACLTGRRLKAAFGDLCDSIIWENCTRELGSEASSKLDPDPEHIRSVLDHFKPDAVLTFGDVACKAIIKARTPDDTWVVMSGPHPAARQPNVTQRLRSMRDRLEMKMKEAA